MVVSDYNSDCDRWQGQWRRMTKATKMDGESVPIASFKGKALLMLNVASL